MYVREFRSGPQICFCLVALEDWQLSSLCGEAGRPTDQMTESEAQTTILRQTESGAERRMPISFPMAGSRQPWTVKLDREWRWSTIRTNQSNRTAQSVLLLLHFNGTAQHKPMQNHYQGRRLATSSSLVGQRFRDTLRHPSISKPSSISASQAVQTSLSREHANQRGHQ